MCNSAVMAFLSETRQVNVPNHLWFGKKKKGNLLLIDLQNYKILENLGVSQEINGHIFLIIYMYLLYLYLI